MEKTADLLSKSDLLESHSTGAKALFEEYYNYARENPLRTGAIGIIGVAAIAAASLAAQKFIPMLEGNFEAAAAQAPAGSKSFRAGAGVLRTIEGNAIPNLERPFLAADGSLDLNLLKLRTQRAYRGDLTKLVEMPSSVIGLKDESLAQFSERVLKKRAELTGESLHPEAFGKETARISALNGDLAADSVVAGKTLVTAAEQDIAKFAQELQFKHTPQIGQFLKGTGKISEEQIEAALKIQRELPPDGPRKLLGEILVENKLAAQVDVDKAFANQQALKAALKDVMTAFFKK